MPTCEFCHRERRERFVGCLNTRDMEGGDRECFDALLRQGGGEFVVNQREAKRRDDYFAFWRERRR